MKQQTLREWRKRRTLTQVQLAEKSGVPQDIISRYERGLVRKPSFDIVVDLASALEIDPRAIKFGQPESSAA